MWMKEIIGIVGIGLMIAFIFMAGTGNIDDQIMTMIADDNGASSPFTAIMIIAISGLWFMVSLSLILVAFVSNSFNPMTNIILGSAEFVIGSAIVYFMPLGWS